MTFKGISAFQKTLVKGLQGSSTTMILFDMSIYVAGPLLRKAVVLNADVLRMAATSWVEVFDFEGSGSRPKTPPVRPTVEEAGPWIYTSFLQTLHATNHSDIIQRKKQCCYPSPQKTNTFHSTVGFPWPELVLLDSHTHHIDPAMDLIMFDHVMSMVGPELLQAHAGWGHWPGQVQEDQDLQWCLGGPQAPLSHP